MARCRRMPHSAGYTLIREPDHPRADPNGYVLEHIVVAENALGRPLPERHPIHHVNEVRDDNRPGNLVICEDDAYHKLLHQRMRAMEACGNPDWLKCKRCKKYDRPENIRFYSYDTAGRHPECERRYARKRYHRRVQRRKQEAAHV